MGTGLSCYRCLLPTRGAPLHSHRLPSSNKQSRKEYYTVWDFNVVRKLIILLIFALSAKVEGMFTYIESAVLSGTHFILALSPVLHVHVQRVIVGTLPSITPATSYIVRVEIVLHSHDQSVHAEENEHRGEEGGRTVLRTALDEHPGNTQVDDTRSPGIPEKGQISSIFHSRAMLSLLSGIG